MYLDPARCRSDILSMILGPPSFHKAHANRALFRQFVHGFEAKVDRLRQQIGKVVVVKNLERLARKYFKHGAVMKVVCQVAVPTLHKDRLVGQTFGVHLTAHVVKVHAFADISTCVLDRRIAIYVAEQTETEAIGVVGWISESIDHDTFLLSVKHFADPIVELEVRNRTPMFRFLKVDRSHFVVMMIHQAVAETVAVVSIVVVVVSIAICLASNVRRRQTR